MSSSGRSVPWGDFTQDPRTPQAAPLRASDRDRDVVTGVLTEAYADGRLTREEYDERAGATAAAKTLGELPPLIADLGPQTPVGASRSGIAGLSAEALHARAVQHWESQRRQAVTGFLIPTVICWAIWVMAALGPDRGHFDAGFPWPLFVMLGTAIHLARVLLNRQDIVSSEERRLEKKQRKALEPPRSTRREQRDDG
jgi:hypothetical protein